MRYLGQCSLANLLPRCWLLNDPWTYCSKFLGSGLWACNPLYIIFIYRILLYICIFVYTKYKFNHWSLIKLSVQWQLHQNEWDAVLQCFALPKYRSKTAKTLKITTLYTNFGSRFEVVYALVVCWNDMERLYLFFECSNIVCGILGSGQTFKHWGSILGSWAMSCFGPLVWACLTWIHQTKVSKSPWTISSLIRCRLRLRVPFRHIWAQMIGKKGQEGRTLSFFFWLFWDIQRLKHPVDGSLNYSLKEDRGLCFTLHGHLS